MPQNKMIVIAYDLPTEGINKVIGGLTTDAEIIFTIREALAQGATHIHINA